MEAEIGIIGGTGFYSLLENATEKEVITKYGRPSSPISIGMIGGKKVAFLARHGKDHSIPPHKVPYRANIEALASLGVLRIISSNAVGSLKKEYRPGDIVFIDQFANMTSGRQDTFFDEGAVVHAAMADPYCSELRELGSKKAKSTGTIFHENGSVVVVNGPRFSTRAESKFFSGQGFDIINMTQYPEAALAREKKICYLGIGIVTDYDVGIEGADSAPVTFEKVQMVFNDNIEKVKQLIHELIPSIPNERSCGCENI